MIEIIEGTRDIVGLDRISRQKSPSVVKEDRCSHLAMWIDCLIWIDDVCIIRTRPPGFNPRSAIEPASSVSFNSTTDYQIASSSQLGPTENRSILTQRIINPSRSNEARENEPDVLFAEKDESCHETRVVTWWCVEAVLEWLRCNVVRWIEYSLENTRRWNSVDFSLLLTCGEGWTARYGILRIGFVSIGLTGVKHNHRTILLRGHSSEWSSLRVEQRRDLRIQQRDKPSTKHNKE